MELLPIQKPIKEVSQIPLASNMQSSVLQQAEVQDKATQFQQKPFIEANTEEVQLRELTENCIIPVFSKDNEKTIAHQEFIEVAQECVASLFSDHNIATPEIRVSHQVKGRTPSAIHKPAKELLPHEKTQYYERMAFIIRIPSIVETVNGNNLSLIVGGVRAYNHENLYTKKSVERFKFFIGFQNMVCCNLCISTDGFQSEMRVGNHSELKGKMLELMQGYAMEKHLSAMQQLPEYSLNETQFAQLIGKAKLYHYLPKEEKGKLPNLMLTDGHMATIAKDYYRDNSFSRDDNGNINLWNVFNLFTSANKASYIDTFLDRNTNVFDFANGLKETISGGSNHSWFLS